ALAAAKFYTSLFPGSKIKSISRYGEAGPGKKGSVMTVAFRLAGQDFVGLNGGPVYKFNPSVSFFVSCKTQAEVDSLWKRLLKGGKPSQCGWLEDRYGLSWQIVPDGLVELIKDPRGMKAMLQMVKLDINVIKKAVAGKPEKKIRR